MIGQQPRSEGMFAPDARSNSRAELEEPGQTFARRTDNGDEDDGICRGELEISLDAT